MLLFPRGSAWIAPAGLLALLAACGGGGGGGGPLGGPSAAIVFPPGTCLTTDDFVRLRGTASDLQGVGAVSVNGNAALTVNGFATWTCTVPLALGDNLLVVQTTDGGGAVNLSAAQVLVRREGPIPLRAAAAGFLPAAGRMLLTDPGAGLIALDLATGARTTVSADGVGAGVAARTSPEPYGFAGVALRPAASRAYVFDDQALGQRILEVNLTNGNRSIVADATTGTGPALPSPSPVMTVDAGDAQLYVGNLSGTLQRVDIATGDRTEIAPGAGSGDSISRATDVVADGGADVLYVLDGLGHAIVAVDLVTLVRTIRSSGSVGTGPSIPLAGELAVDPVAGRAYTHSIRTLLAVDLATGNRSVLSDALTATGTGPDLTEVCDLVWDAGGNRILATRQTGGVFAIDPTTGNRTLLHEPTFGTGPLFTPTDVGASPLGTAAYFLDDLNGAPGLVALDLATGTRSVVADATTGLGPTVHSRMRIAVAPSGLEAYLLEDTQLLEVDLGTGDRSVFASTMLGTGPALVELNDLALGQAPGTLVASENTAGMLLVSVASGDRSVLASVAAMAGDIGSADMALDPVRGLAYLSDSDADRVYRVDLAAPGVAQALLAVGPGSPAPFDDNLSDVTFDVVRDALFLHFDGEDFLVRLNPQADNATAVSGGGVASGPELALTRLDADPGRGVVYASAAGGLLATDTTTGDRVILALTGTRQAGNP